MGGNQGLTPFKTLQFRYSIHQPAASWKSNQKIRSLRQHTYTDLKERQKQCNFTNNAATIQIYVKGLKNAHTFTAHVYKKEPQTLTDAIDEVEKLRAAQQLTATVLPLSTVNMMSNEEDQCFQCQQLGHTACHCPNIRCFE